MDVHELLEKLISSGVEFSVVDGTLRCKAPKGALTPELQVQLKRNKEKILAAFTAETEAIKKLPAFQPLPKDQVFREYQTPFGTVQLTKEEFNQVVDYFRWLYQVQKKLMATRK